MSDKPQSANPQGANAEHGARRIPDVVPGDDRAQPPGRADRLQPGDTGTDHQHLVRAQMNRRRDRRGNRNT